MTIDKEQLISLLIDKTGLEPEEVESQLSELINRIQQAAEKGKTFEIEGFGVFSMADGDLQFEPHDTLETEINNKYAGMKPIELIGAFKEPEGDEVPDMPEEELEKSEGRWAFDESAMEETSEEPVAANSDSEEEHTEQLEENQQNITSSEDHIDKVFGTEEPTESDQDEKQPAQQKQTALQVSDTADYDDEPDTLGRLLVAAVVVIALGVGSWIIYDISFSGNSHAGEVSQQTRVPAQQTGDIQQEPSENPSSQKSGGNKTSEPEQDKTVGKQEGSTTETEAQQQNRFGLKGKYNQSIGGYTIVVHSLKDMNVAEYSRKNLEERGFRALINKAVVRGTTYYRVGIGQFETVSDATQAMSDLPQRYRENNFIKRIQ